ncbi:SpaA isopeptide-forming pilin-related protein [Erysipelothrix anatis]|uniref:SpaA isopeptide-forming pilin-related protein n=1 Tax=Erysipelothrix anatis TaxID=2683713 RepID=UPI001358DCA1|nr:SpaA isopeptide-forming pilin-related protein [Erysipelothrix anatis]
MKYNKLLTVILTIAMSFVSFGVGPSTYADTPEVQTAGNFYEDYPEANNHVLGAAGYFHLFARDVVANSHTNGNIAAIHFTGQGDIGTKQYNTTGNIDVSYLRSYTHLQSGSFPTRDKTKFVVGSGMSVDLSNANQPRINGSTLDNLSADTIFQDPADHFYIDIESELNALATTSAALSREVADLTITNDSFPDRNNRVIDVTAIDKNQILVNLDGSVLDLETPIVVKGLEKNTGGSFKQVFITVDYKGAQSATIQSTVLLEYADGSRRGNKESVDFSDSTLLWNFTTNGAPMPGTITFRGTWIGSILAPKAHVVNEKNIDGSIIVDSFTSTGETHRWDFQDPEPLLIRLRKTDAAESSKVLKGAIFKLVNAAGTVIYDNLTTDVLGEIKVSVPKAGTYCFIETQAPEGYTLDSKEKCITITESMMSSAEILVEVTNVKTPDKPDPKPEPLQLRLRKTDAKDSSKVLKDAEFKLVSEDGTVIEEGLTTDALGEIRVDVSEAGTYCFIETKAPTGYTLDKTKKCITVTETMMTQPEVLIEVTNTKTPDKPEPKPEPLQLRLRKNDAKDSSKVLKDAEFKLVSEDGTVIAEGLTTDALGEIRVGVSEAGTYCFIETKAPTGYTLDETKKCITVTESMMTQPEVLIEVTNSRIPEKPTPEKPTPEKPTPEKPTPEKPTPEKPTPQEPEKPENVILPKTGQSNTLVQWGLIIAGIGVVIGGFVLYNKKRNNDK